MIFAKQKGKIFKIDHRGLLCPKCNKPTYRWVVYFETIDSLCDSCKKRIELWDEVIKKFKYRFFS